MHEKKYLIKHTHALMKIVNFVQASHSLQCQSVKFSSFHSPSRGEWYFAFIVHGEMVSFFSTQFKSALHPVEEVAELLQHWWG